MIIISINSTKTSTLVSYVAVFLNAIIGIVFTPFIIRGLGDSQYGIYTICSSLIGFFLMDFGLGSAASRYITKYHIVDDKENEKKAISTIFQLFLIIDLIIAIAFIIIVFFLGNIYASLSNAEIQQLRIVFCISAFSSVITFPFLMLNGILTSYEKFVHIKIADIVNKIFCVCTISFVLILNLGLTALVIVNSVASVLVVIYKLIILKRSGVVFEYKPIDKELMFSVLKFSLWITVMAISHRLIFTVVPSILGMVSNTTEAAHFSVVLTIENYFYLISTAFSGMFMPKVSRIFNSSNSKNELLALVKKVALIIYLVNIFIFVGVAFLGKDFLRLWAGPGYDSVYLGLLFVVFPSIFYNSMEILNTAVMVKNKVKYSGLINLFCGLLNIGLCVVLSMKYGANGACVSIMISSALRSILSYIMYNKVLGVDMLNVIYNVFVKTLPAVLIVCIFGFTSVNIIGQHGWFGFIIRGIIIVIGILISGIVFYRNEIKSIVGIKKGNMADD